MHSPLTSSFG
jgi:outer membrane lipoprotein SlyB